MEKENLSVPKHRFDCVNVALKETRQKLINLSKENDALKSDNEKLKKQLLISKVETELAKAHVRNIKAAMALIDLNQLSIDEEDKVMQLEHQILSIKNNHKYLFDNDETAYMLVPFQLLASEFLKFASKNLSEREDKNDSH